MPASDDLANADLIAATAALRAWADEAFAALGVQVWVADDLGFHPRAVLGRDCTDADRDCARQCCLLGQAVVHGSVVALPLTLTDRSSGACVFALPAQAGEQSPQPFQAQVDAMSAQLDAALHSERLQRLSGLARKSDQLRATLTLAHTLEHCEQLAPTLTQLHQSLKTLMYAENFFVVLLDEPRHQLNFEYSVDQFDSPEEPIAFLEGRLQGSLSAFVVAAGRILRGSSLELMTQAGHVDMMGSHSYGPPAADWLGVPMMVANEALGAVVVQSYDPDIRFTDADPSMLSMVADTMAEALHRRRLREALERTVAERTRQYEQSNQTLQDTVSTLERAMRELVQAEKLASLGSMVAGISHELNTPIGNAVTVSTALDERFAQLTAQVAEGGLTRSGLDSFLSAGREMNSLVVRSTQRAAELISSFKQVAVDQTSAQRRVFDLQQVVESILIASAHALDRPQIHIHNAIPAALVCDSYPGPLGQVVANLIQNALLHAFSGPHCGSIQIAAELQGLQVWLSVTDDGAGMSAQVLARAFDPFFTTRLGQGGSGLGLAVCHRIVTSVLGGDLSVSSALGQGACFVLKFPAHAPYKL